MLLIYDIGIHLYYLLVCLASLFSSKAKLWVTGRKHQVITSSSESCIWFHFASLGEFEQGRPVLEHLRNLYPQLRTVITFFSPSGYEIRKNSALADAVYYLPLDAQTNLRQFIEAIKPEFAVFTKYEYWYYCFKELQNNRIPLYIISSIFRPEQIFFKWYGGIHRRMLHIVNQFFVQDDASRELLQTIAIANVKVSGDTRFDRVWANAKHPKPLPLIQGFKNKSPLFIGGSTWSKDEELIILIINQYPDWKFIIAPHEISESKINDLMSLLPSSETIRYSAIDNLSQSISAYRILVIDNIGMLSALYQYADVAYIGGGFGVGIHNTLEAAAFGLPVIFGPNYQKFREARDLIALQAGFSVADAEEFNQITQKLITDRTFRLQAGQKAAEYVQTQTGATEIIAGYISQHIKM